MGVAMEQMIIRASGDRCYLALEIKQDPLG